MTNPTKNILVICGPTASGKTSLALKIAKCLSSSSQVNLLSADSRQIYRGLDIVTGKDIPPDLPSSIKFYGLDLVDPNEEYNLADFVDYSTKVIEDSISNHIPLIIVGGTGLYLKAITSNLLNTHVPPNIKMRIKLEKLSISELQNKLSKVDPLKYSSINNSDINNPRRLIRAIEIASSSLMRTIGTRKGGSIAVNSVNYIWIGLKQDKENLERVIQDRINDRLKNNAEKEVENLVDKFPNRKLPVFTSLGVKEILDYKGGILSRDEMINRWLKAEIDYARRQMVWFNKQPNIVWYDKGTVNSFLIAKISAKIN